MGNSEYEGYMMPPPLRDRILEQLGDEIAAGALAPGTQLNERSLGERFGISRTPAREVLLQLSSAGLVRFLPRRGAVVLTLEPKEIVSMVEVLIALEGEAAALATRRMEADERREMAESYARAASAIERLSTEEYSKANVLFHNAIYAGCRNQFLTDEIRKLRLRLAPYLRHSFVRQGRLRSSHSEHQAILAAIEHCDDAAAEAAMRLHLLNGGNLFADMLSKLERK
jgi:DNA-binding GntR family transcriptional regulator